MYAGTACTERPVTVEAFRQADRLARQVLAVLDKEVHNAAILARAGADSSRYGLRFSHAALVLRDSRAAPWRVVHLLNHCGQDNASLYQQGLINFFLDDPFEYAALLLVPGERLQNRLVQEVLRGTVSALFESRYDMLSHPKSLQAQNSNQWLLELVAAAQAGRSHTRATAQRWLYEHGFRADIVNISAVQRLAARLFKANVGFDGQRAAQLLAGRVQVVTVRSLARYLRATEPDLARTVLTVPSPRASQHAVRRAKDVRAQLDAGD